MNIPGSAVRLHSSTGVASSHTPSGLRSPASFKTPPVHEQVVEGEVLLNKRAEPKSSYYTTPIISSDKINSYLQHAQNNIQEISVGYYIDYFA